MTPWQFEFLFTLFSLKNKTTMKMPKHRSRLRCFKISAAVLSYHRIFKSLIFVLFFSLHNRENIGNVVKSLDHSCLFLTFLFWHSMEITTYMDFVFVFCRWVWSPPLFGFKTSEILKRGSERLVFTQQQYKVQNNRTVKV